VLVMNRGLEPQVKSRLSRFARKAFLRSASALRESACPLHPQISNSRRRSLLLSLCFSLSLATCYLLLGGLCSAFAFFFGPLVSAFF